MPANSFAGGISANGQTPVRARSSLFGGNTSSADIAADFDGILFATASYFFYFAAIREAIVLSLDRNTTTNLTFSWIGPGTLQSAPDLSGPWQVETATQPFIIPLTTNGNRFYRVVEE